MPSEHDARQRASICQDCWFWKEMSCALPSPESGSCANKRPVQGRRATTPARPAQAQLVPLAPGHATVVDTPLVAPAAEAVVPFSATAPEATFSLAQVRDEQVGSTAAAEVPITGFVDEVIQPLRATPPSFREIRSGRAAAAARVPIAEVRIPVQELDGGLFASVGETPPPAAVPGMEQLVERVRQRTAARLSRARTDARA